MVWDLVRNDREAETSSLSLQGYTFLTWAILEIVLNSALSFGFIDHFWKQTPSKL